MAKPHIALINASLGGDTGNTAFVLARARRLLARRAKTTAITLGPSAVNQGSTPGRNPTSSAATALSAPAAPPVDFGSVRAELATADAFVVGTGTHWDSWSSLLQKFLEDATPSEGTKLWLGKPAAVLVTEHSVGGKGVVSRLQGVLATFGCQIPPMSGLVISKSALLATRLSAQPGSGAADEAEDFWSLNDLPVVCHNLVEAASATNRWRAWPVDREDFSARWIR